MKPDHFRVCACFKHWVAPPLRLAGTAVVAHKLRPGGHTGHVICSYTHTHQLEAVCLSVSGRVSADAVNIPEQTAF